MKEEGMVIKTEDEKAFVRIIRNSACSKCKKKCSLAENSEQSEMVVEVKNNADAERGQKVILEMKEQNLVFAAILVYLFPLLAMIGGYFITDWLLIQLGFQIGEVTGIIGSLFFLGLSYLLIKNINHILEEESDFNPVIKRVL